MDRDTLTPESPEPGAGSQFFRSTEPSEENVIEGVLFSLDETGSRGGHWAFQNKGFITPNEMRFFCRICHLYWDKEACPLVPGWGTRHYRGSIPPDYLGVHPDQMKTCPPDQHEFELTSPENWSYDGMHILVDGDHLTIFDKNDTTVVVWSGAIRLRSFQPYTEKALGCWINADQDGVEREIWARWFFDRYPARLEPADRKVATTQRFTLSIWAAKKRAAPNQRQV